MYWRHNGKKMDLVCLVVPDCSCVVIYMTLLTSHSHWARQDTLFLLVRWSTRTSDCGSPLSLHLQVCRRWPRFPAFAPADSVLMLDAGTYFASLLFTHLVFSQEPPHSQSLESRVNAHQKIRHDMLQTSVPPPPKPDTETSYCCYLIIYSNVKRQNLVYVLSVGLILFFYDSKAKLMTVILASLT